MHPQEDSDTGYFSYMLRMWLRRNSKGEAEWCASLEEPGSRRTESFSDINEMFTFIQNRLDIEMRGRTAQNEPME